MRSREWKDTLKSNAPQNFFFIKTSHPVKQLDSLQKKVLDKKKE